MMFLKTFFVSKINNNKIIWNKNNHYVKNNKFNLFFMLKINIHSTSINYKKKDDLEDSNLYETNGDLYVSNLYIPKNLKRYIFKPYENITRREKFLEKKYQKMIKNQEKRKLYNIKTNHHNNIQQFSRRQLKVAELIKQTLSRY